jgi:hypothetical protein
MSSIPQKSLFTRHDSMLNYLNCKGRLNGKTGNLKSGQSYDKNRKKNIQTLLNLKSRNSVGNGELHLWHNMQCYYYDVWLEFH